MAVLNDGIGRHRGHAGRIEREKGLQPLQGIDHQCAQQVEGKHGQRVLHPVHGLVGEAPAARYSGASTLCIQRGCSPDAKRASQRPTGQASTSSTIM